MNFSRVGIIAAAFLAQVAMADEGPRPIGVVLNTKLPLPEVKACLMHYFIKGATVTPIPLSDGDELDIVFRSGITSAKPRFILVIHDHGDERTLEGFYRRPLSAYITGKLMKDSFAECDATPGAR